MNISNSNKAILDGQESVNVLNTFEPHFLNSDCPQIICKGSSMDSTYLSSPQDQSIPVFIKQHMELNNFSLLHQEDFFAGQSILMSPGYDSGLIGTISCYDILPCTIQTWTPCWDLNNNGAADINEDLNNNGIIDSNDCN